jgi:ubiquitin-conjugating enzyme E2 D/E
MAEKRIKAELRKIRTDQPANCTIWTETETNRFKWVASILGPANSPYEDGTFFLNILFPSNYPFHPPDFHLITPIYHPNISSEGHICTCLLKKRWSPALTIHTVLLTVREVMSSPSAVDHVLREDIAELYRSDKQQFERVARERTVLYAM